MSYAARTKYDEPGRARRYAERSPRRSAAEWRLLSGMVRALDPQPSSALDVPCGTGRIALGLLDLGIPTQLADLSPAMLEQARLRVGDRNDVLGIVELDLEAVSDGVFAADLVVCFRFLPHCPDAETRRRVLTGLRRLTRRDLFLSFHHPISAHNATRALRRCFGRRASDRHTISVGRLGEEAAAAGFDLVGTRALAAWRRELWIAHLRPRPAAEETS